MLPLLLSGVKVSTEKKVLQQNNGFRSNVIQIYLFGEVDSTTAFDIDTYR